MSRVFVGQRSLNCCRRGWSGVKLFRFGSIRKIFRDFFLLGELRNNQQ